MTAPADAMSANIAPAPPCPVCRSTRCLAGQEYAPGKAYGHRWADGPMASAHARWKDERTPPASPEEAMERGLVEPNNIETLSPIQPDVETPVSVSGADVETLSAATCAECNKPFTPARATARFCSPACRLKAHRRVEAQP